MTRKEKKSWKVKMLYFFDSSWWEESKNIKFCSNLEKNLRKDTKIANLSSKNDFFDFSALFSKLDDFFFTFSDSFDPEESKNYKILIKQLKRFIKVEKIQKLKQLNNHFES